MLDKVAVEKKKSKFKAVDIAFVALMSAVIAVCSWISVFIGDIPYTFQTFAVFAAAGLLGCRRSLLSLTVYILLGAVGVPVFSGFRGGLGVLLGPTGGYIVGFVFIALLVGFAVDKFGRKISVMIISMLLALIVMYAFGTVWFMCVYIKNTGAISLVTVLGKCVFPYIIPDIIKMALAIAVVKAVAPRVKIL